MDIKTTDGSVFTYVQSVDLARLVWKRFGHDDDAALAAWRRMLENDCTMEDFIALVESETHTPHCDGECRAAQYDRDHEED